MAVQLTNDSIKMGYVLPVANMGMKSKELPKYYALKIEDEDGGNERWILLSFNDLISRQILHLDGFSPKLGKKLKFSIGSKEYQFINVHLCEDTKFKNGVELKSGDNVILTFTDYIINRGLNRASKNQEDIPNQSLWNDLKD